MGGNYPRIFKWICNTFGDMAEPVAGLAGAHLCCDAEET